LEGLWGELGENSGIYDYTSDSFGGCPPGPPTKGADFTDDFAPMYHAILERYVRGQNRALQSNMRSDGGSSSEVWNHAVWKYTASYTQAPGTNERLISIRASIAANQDHTPPTDDSADRTVQYAYQLTYNATGVVDDVGGVQDWISVGGDASYAPYNLLAVTNAGWDAVNPHVTESNVRGLDIAN
jgi:hypothetical protein